ncbi:hypothetical protein ACK8OR_04560 [Jannaschia sp. KMU-145]|uniref:hypothetical protein n=1 Tax=Jannaschia halovivens TaxID=3388667 RepID=UPI00396AF430
MQRTIATLALGATTILAAGYAQAQSTFAYDGALTSANTTNRSGAGSVGGAGTRAFDAVPIRVDGSGTLTVQTTAASTINNFAPSDTVIYLVSGAFDPTVATTPLAYNDDGLGFGGLSIFTIDVPDGNYSVVVFGFSSTATGTFSLAGSGAVLGWGPSVPVQLAAADAAFATLARRFVVQAGGVARSNAGVGLDRTNPLTFASTRGVSGTPVHSWIEFTGFAARGSDIDQSATGFQLGADIEIAPNMVAGLSIGTTDLSSVQGGFDISGDLQFVQPYLAMRSGAYRGEASLIWGRGDFDQVTAGGLGTGDTELYALTLSGAYDMAMGDGDILSPMASLSIGREEVEGTGGTLAGAGTSKTTFGTLSVGARYTSQMEMGTGFVGLHADYDYAEADTALVAGFEDGGELSARIEFGADVNLTDGLSLRMNADFGGIGTGTDEIAGGLKLVYRF